MAIQPDLPTRMNNLSTMAKIGRVPRPRHSHGRGRPARDPTHRGEAAAYVPHGTPDELADALNALIDDAEARARMRTVGLRRFAEVLSWDHQAQDYVALWRRLLAKRLSSAEATARQAAEAR